MTFQEVLQYLFPYFHGIRKLKNYVSVELIFPKTWDFPNEILQKAQVEQNEKYSGEGYFLIFVSQLTDDFNHMVEVIAELINHNLEREEKERLLKAKVMELKEIFKASSLDELKGLKINLEHDDMDDVDHLLKDEQEAEV